MAKQTKAQIKTAIRNVLDKVAVGSEGGSLSGSLIIEGEDNFIKAPNIIVGENKITDLLNTKVNVDGDQVINGKRVFTGKIEVFSNTINISNKNVIKGVTPASNQYQSITFNAGNNRAIDTELNSGNYDTCMAILKHQTMADGSVDFHMGCYRNVADSRDVNLLRVGFDASGAPFASCCTPIASSNSGAIATTQWVTAKADNYLPLSGGKTITGTLTVNGITTINNEMRVGGSVSNQLRLIYNNKAVICRNDGANFYLMTTNADDALGGYNDLRPLFFNLSNGTVTMGHGLRLNAGQITKTSTSTFWCKGRDTALLRITDGEHYCPILSMKCDGGSWEVGSSGSANGSNLSFSFISDANYNSNTNTQTFNHRFDQNGDFIVHRDIRASGGWVYGNSFRVNSDRRLKKDIQDVDYELPNVSLKTFKFKNDIKEKTHIGYIAQDIKTQTPQFVDTDENGMLSLDESALLMTAIHEINRLKARIAELEKKL